MQPENFNQEQQPVQQSSSLHQVTPLSKYLAMTLFIILPFVGGWIGYQYAPEKVVEVEELVESNDTTEDLDVLQNTEEKSTSEDGELSADLLNYLLNTRHLAEDAGVSQNSKYFTYVDPVEAALKVVDLQRNEVVNIVTSETLSFLGVEYYQLSTDTLLLPNNIGNAVFIDLADASARDIENEAILVLDNDDYKVLRLPNVTEFEWLSDKELSYRYKAVVEDQSVCEGVMSMCIPVRVVDEWIYDEINLEDSESLEDSW